MLLRCSPLLPLLGVAVGDARAQVDETGLSQERLSVAEGVIAREEAASQRAFDPAFRNSTMMLLASLPDEALAAAQMRDAGLSADLGDSQADLV